MNIQLGLLNKVEELHKQITNILGSSEYRSFANGRELHLREETQRTLNEVGLTGSVSLMITKKPSDNDQISEPAVRGILNSVEAEILKHFDALYEMLDFREPQGCMVSISTSLPILPEVN